MQPLIVLLAVTAVCAFPRPPAAEPLSSPHDEEIEPGTMEERLRELTKQEMYDLYQRAFLIPYYLKLNEEIRHEQSPKQYEWLAKEIERLNLMEFTDDIENDDQPKFRGYNSKTTSWNPQFYHKYLNTSPEAELETEDIDDDHPNLSNHFLKNTYDNTAADFRFHAADSFKREFAITPFDQSFYGLSNNPPSKDSKESDTKEIIPITSKAADPPKTEALQASEVIETPRQTRQNPNLSKTKTLVAENIDKLRAGTSSEDLATHAGPRGEGRMAGKAGEAQQAAPDSIYSIAVIAAVGAAITVTLVGFGVGWYSLSRKAKAAMDVEYPAYGVTGPSVESAMDRKLAHSAHMYHYQHQKQQILAMERSGMEQRQGSFSDPESEEENEEGDYTVYECPGFATTGNMEVKNPIFSEEPTPLTPATCEIVKPQMRE